jgi:hypothetical protein
MQLMIDMCAHSIVFFLYCCGLLGLFVSIFAIFFVQGLAYHLRHLPEPDPQLQHDVSANFGSVKLGMLSLFMAVTGGNDWSVYHDILQKISPFYEGLWIFYIMFAFFAIFNITASVFVEKAMSITKPTAREERLEKYLEDESYAEEMLSLLQNVDCWETRCLTSSTFQDFISMPEVLRYFEHRGRSPAALEKLFRLLLMEESSDSVALGTFVSAVLKLDRSASSADLHVLHAEMRRFRLAVQQQFEDMNCSMTKTTSPR